MTAKALICWKCGASLEHEPLPLARLSECRSCHADLHVCKLCEFHDPRVASACREPVADEVQDKEHANFCGYFQPRPDAWSPAANSAAQNSSVQLNALFADEGDDSTSVDAGPTHEALEKLFGDGEGS